MQIICMHWDHYGYLAGWLLHSVQVRWFVSILCFTDNLSPHECHMSVVNPTYKL
jgi:hypothetical protein